MSNETKNLGLIALLLAAIVAFLMLRRKASTMTQVSSTIIGARSMSGELNPTFTGAMKDSLDQTLQRICRYETASLQWPYLAQPCPPSYVGQSLVSDTIERAL
jgi:hypothetical protein